MRMMVVMSTVRMTYTTSYRQEREGGRGGEDSIWAGMECTKKWVEDGKDEKCEEEEEEKSSSSR